MSEPSEATDTPDFGLYLRNRNAFPRDELLKYGGQHVAFSLDGTRILASGDDIPEVEARLRAAGIKRNQVVLSFVDPPGVTGAL
jgi:hypothetical protein